MYMKFKLNYAVIPLAVIAVALAGSGFTSLGMAELGDGSGASWYSNVIKPSWTPPGPVIGAVWTVLFILGAISALLAYNAAKQGARRAWIVGAFIANALLNVSWSYLFFYKHLVGTAAIEAGILGCSVVALIILIWPVSRIASALLIPYAVWVFFATYLTYAIWTLNLTYAA